MHIFRGSWSSFTDVRDSVVTVGFFDGLHRGHRAILERVTEAARAQGLRSVVLTFDTHPRDILKSPASSVPLLTTIEEKLSLLTDAGIDLTMVIPFDQGISQITAADFVQIVLRGRVGMRRVVVGFNHGFGKMRGGDRETLIAMSKTLGFSVDVVNPTRVGDAIVSSTYLRELIADGHVAKAAEALGRYYSVKGVIMHGFGRGKKMNFPTANLGGMTPGKLCPRDGIYAGWAIVRGETHPAAIASGFNPTFPEGKHSLEAHLIGFDDDIYDEVLELRFVDYIRSEKKFSGLEELSAQIAEDVKNCSAVLESKRVADPAVRPSGTPEA